MAYTVITRQIAEILYLGAPDTVITRQVAEILVTTAEWETPVVSGPADRITHFDGEPKIYIDKNGATLDFRGGQPVMDTGLENSVNISLFTRQGWWGNDVLPTENEIGSDFEETAEQPITAGSFNDVELAGERAVDWGKKSGLFKATTAEATNPSGRSTAFSMVITPPSDDPFQLLFIRNGINWIQQKLDPAYRK